MQIRLTKIFLMVSAALFVTLVVINNITDYQSNYLYVQHVLSMDTTFQANEGLWRRIESPVLHHLAYAIIILMEILIAIVGWVGIWRLWRTRSDPVSFNRAKPAAIWALSGGILLWFGGFIAIGGEWFLMWQSEIWNAQEESAMFSILFALILIYLIQEDR